MNFFKILLITFLFSAAAAAAEVCGTVKSVLTQSNPPTGYNLSWKVNFQNGQSLENVVARIKIQSFVSETMEILGAAFDMAVNSAIQGLWDQGSEESSNPSSNFLLCFVPSEKVYKFSGVSKG